MNEELKGFKAYRHENNLKEKELHDQFIREFQLKDMELIVFGHMDGVGDSPSGQLSEREQRIVVSTIQWLGSPSGNYFLRNVGFCQEVEYSIKQRLFSDKIAKLEAKLSKIPKWVKALCK